MEPADDIEHGVGDGEVYRIIYGKDILDTQIEMDCDRLINKILYYLSK